MCRNRIDGLRRIRYGVSSYLPTAQPRCTHAFLSPGDFVSRMAAALLVSRYAACQRNDCVAVAAPRFRNHLDWAALFFQSGAHTGNEKVRSQAANQDLSRADAWRDGLVSFVGAGDRDRGIALLHDPSGLGCETCGRPFPDWQVVR